MRIPLIPQIFNAILIFFSAAQTSFSIYRFIVNTIYCYFWHNNLVFLSFQDGDFCGLAEFYGFRDKIHKISIGYRRLRRKWDR